MKTTKYLVENFKTLLDFILNLAPFYDYNVGLVREILNFVGFYFESGSFMCRQTKGLVEVG